MTLPVRIMTGVVSYAFLALLISGDAFAGGERGAFIESGVRAVLSDTHTIFLECTLPKDATAAETFFRSYLPPDAWQRYRNCNAVAIRYESLMPEARRRILLALFPDDNVDGDGWWHVISDSGNRELALLRSLCGWVTGNPATIKIVLADPRNSVTRKGLTTGQRVLISTPLLLKIMRTPSPPRTATSSSKTTPSALSSPAKTPLGAPGNGDDKPADLEAVAQELSYGKDTEGEYALYHLKSGEALYTAVVVRFTDFRDNDDILRACATVQKRSHIKNVHDMKCGQAIYIPLDMLSDRYAPKGSKQRQDFEQTMQEAKRLRQEQIKAHGLDGVVVVIDPGHGGRDEGARDPSRKLFEDEINYDIACRAKKILDTQTRAHVYMTLRDPDRMYEPQDRHTFEEDKDEEVLTTPPYRNQEAKISANLRWYVANSIYNAERRRGIDPRKMVFVSFHTDAQFNATLRGAMIYIPGAQYRRSQEQPAGSIYNQFKECREQRRVTFSDAELRRDEALSRNLADDVMTALGNHKIRRHLEGDWIRTQIRQDGGRVYLPAVLRNTQIPTKILIEVANMTNDTDCGRLADPQWRQDFATAFVEAVKAYYGE